MGRRAAGASPEAHPARSAGCRACPRAGGGSWAGRPCRCPCAPDPEVPPCARALTTTRPRCRHRPRRRPQPLPLPPPPAPRRAGCAPVPPRP
ncbi:hypothetical protein EST54_13710 [Streptomyces sioyaensis]|uniref:Uncharacterized protein n=1 Tax=Streptomyces sioyaensis TaxID=67364 RepID=A0A4Q1R3H8_9ACTN|nr:hypothetical protein EST54_13710 [Streptomyces sioyaensis]